MSSGRSASRRGLRVAVTGPTGDIGRSLLRALDRSRDVEAVVGMARRPFDPAAEGLRKTTYQQGNVLDRESTMGLVEGADVLVHSMRPQKIAALGFAPEAVCRRHPRIIYAGLHGYRNGGPYSGQPAYDDVIQAQTGIAALMAPIAGEPRYAPMIVADKTCALTAANAITAALFARERTGRGQFVEIPMLETMAAFVLTEHLFGHTFVPPEGSPGYSRVLAPWRRPYRTADGRICMLAYTDAQWRRFWQAAGQPEMMDDPRFADLAARTRHIDDVYRLAGEALAGRTSREWLALLDKLEIPAGPVNALEDLPDDPHLAAIGFFRHVRHPSEGEIVMPDIPLRFSQSPGDISRLPPGFGEHGREVLGEIGLSTAEIDALAASGALVLPD